MRRLYLHLPRFPVQRAVRDLPGLRHAPLALVQSHRGEQRVAFVSSAGLRAGVEPGMGLAAARARVPELKSLPFDPEVEARALLALGEALLAWGPAFQPVPPDGLFLDASAAPLCKGAGMPEENLAGRVLSTAEGFGLRGQAVVASRAFPARALARLSRARVQCVLPGEERQRLAPLPLSVLEEVSPREAASLRALGLSTLGEVADLPTASVLARLGAAGGRAQALCRGED
ncbi:MAG: DNA polymerase Y family protein, partial [Deltaproteobacteria bacterium]|nr:DNA polymerase Y family protein [Deltaproteobacteria bacterium]